MKWVLREGLGVDPFPHKERRGLSMLDKVLVLYNIEVQLHPSCIDVHTVHTCILYGIVHTCILYIRAYCIYVHIVYTCILYVKALFMEEASIHECNAATDVVIVTRRQLSCVTLGAFGDVQYSGRNGQVR